MKPITVLIAAVTAIAWVGATPAVADPGKGKGQKFKHAQRGHVKHGKAQRGVVVRHGKRVDYIANCPPGLAKKNPPCVPPGQARKHDVRYGTGIGDILRLTDYSRITDYNRYDLKRQRGWDYYRDDNRIFRVDRETRQILAVLNLINAFTR